MFRQTQINLSLVFFLKEELRKPKNAASLKKEISELRIAKMKKVTDSYRPESDSELPLRKTAANEGLRSW